MNRVQQVCTLNQTCKRNCDAFWRLHRKRISTTAWNQTTEAIYTLILH